MKRRYFLAICLLPTLTALTTPSSATAHRDGNAIVSEINKLGEEYLKRTKILNERIRYFAQPDTAAAGMARKLSDMHARFQELFQELATKLGQPLN